jgi:hypothetical protein
MGCCTLDVTVILCVSCVEDVKRYFLFSTASDGLWVPPSLSVGIEVFPKV